MGAAWLTVLGALQNAPFLLRKIKRFRKTGVFDANVQIYNLNGYFVSADY
jgi:hypothetical protein